MTRWFWLLALPYVVTYSSHPDQCPEYHSVFRSFDCKASETSEIKKGKISIIRFDGPAGTTKEYMEDLAAALNEAHERRRSEKAEQAISEIKFQSMVDDAAYRVKQNNFDYKSACGQDDCGKESQ